MVSSVPRLARLPGTGGLAAEIVETVELVVLARAHLLLEGAAGLGLAGDLFLAPALLGLEVRDLGRAVTVDGLVAPVHTVGAASGTAGGPVGAGRRQGAPAALIVAAAIGAIGTGGRPDRAANGTAALCGDRGRQQQEGGTQQGSGPERNPFDGGSQGVYLWSGTQSEGRGCTVCTMMRAQRGAAFSGGAGGMPRMPFYRRWCRLTVLLPAGMETAADFGQGGACRWGRCSVVCGATVWCGGRRGVRCGAMCGLPSGEALLS